MGDSKGYGRKNLVVLGYNLVHKMARSQSYLTTRLEGVGEWFSKLPEFPYTSYLRTGVLNENPSHLSPKKLLQKKNQLRICRAPINSVPSPRRKQLLCSNEPRSPPLGKNPILAKTTVQIYIVYFEAYRQMEIKKEKVELNYCVLL